MNLIPFTFTNNDVTSTTKKIVVEFDAPITNQIVSKTNLRYDKLFIVDMSYDDSLRAQPATMLPLCQGGNARYQDAEYNYLYELGVPAKEFTDGCGSGVSFNFMTSFCGEWINPVAALYMSISEFQRLYQSGMNYCNHGYEHKQFWYAMAPIATVGTDYIPSTSDREDETLTTYFVDDYSYYLATEDGDYPNFGLTGITAGDVMIYRGDAWEKDYYDFAADEGIPTTTIVKQLNLNYEWAKKNSGVKIKSYNGPGGYEAYNPFCKLLGYISDRSGLNFRTLQQTTSEGYPLLMESDMVTDTTLPTIMSEITAAHDASTSTENYRYSFFCHDMDRAIGTGGGISYENMKTLLAFIEDNYGRYGDDTAWVTDQFQIASYANALDNLVISEEVVGNKLIITTDYKNCYQDIREHAISLKVSADQNIVNVTTEGIDTFSFNITTGLINTSTETTLEKLVMIGINARIFVEDFELVSTEAQHVIAQNAIDLLTAGTLKDSLQDRIDAVTITAEGTTILINFGPGSLGHTGEFPWNNLSEFADGTIATGLTSSTGVSTTFSMESTSGFAATDSGWSVAIEGYTKDIVQDSWRTDVGITGILTFKNLDNDLLYDFKVLCAREYTGKVQDVTVGGITIQTDTKVDHTPIYWTDITPVNNEISLSIYSSGEKSRINVVELTEH